MELERAVDSRALPRLFFLRPDLRLLSAAMGECTVHSSAIDPASPSTSLKLGLYSSTFRSFNLSFLQEKLYKWICIGV